MTTPARTALDLTAELELPEALMVVDAALRLELGNLVGHVDRRAYRNTRAVTAAMGSLQEAAKGVKGRARRAHVQAVLAIASPLRKYTPRNSGRAGTSTLRACRRRRCRCGCELPWVTCTRTARGRSSWSSGRQTVRASTPTSRRSLGRRSVSRRSEDLGWSVFRWTGREGFGTPDSIVDRARRTHAAGRWIG